MDVILMQPQTAGNVGAVARLCYNFGVRRLVLIEPLCDHLSFEAQQRAKHGTSFLESAVVAAEAILDDYQLVVGTTSRTGGEKNIGRSAVSPEQLHVGSGDVALLFGNEGTGLSSDVLRKCDSVVFIPSSGALNLSHAVAVLLYACASQLEDGKRLAPRSVLDEMEKQLHAVLESVGFPEERHLETQKRTWKKVFGRSALTEQEAKNILGLLKRLLKP